MAPIPKCLQRGRHRQLHLFERLLWVVTSAARCNIYTLALEKEVLKMKQPLDYAKITMCNSVKPVLFK